MTWRVYEKPRRGGSRGLLIDPVSIQSIMPYFRPSWQDRAHSLKRKPMALQK